MAGLAAPRYIVVRSSKIETRDEAIHYMHARIAGSHEVVCNGRAVRLSFDRAATHFYSEGVDDESAIGPAELVEWRRGPRIERRRFSLDRAVHLDDIIPAVRRYVVALNGNAPKGRENFILFGPAFNDGRHMKVVVQHVRGEAWLCVSAFPVGPRAFTDAMRSRKARWPPWPP